MYLHVAIQLRNSNHHLLALLWTVVITSLYFLNPIVAKLSKGINREETERESYHLL